MNKSKTAKSPSDRLIQAALAVVVTYGKYQTWKATDDELADTVIELERASRPFDFGGKV